MDSPRTSFVGIRALKIKTRAGVIMFFGVHVNMHACEHAFMYGWMDGLMDRIRYPCMHGCICGWMAEYTCMLKHTLTAGHTLSGLHVERATRQCNSRTRSNKTEFSVVCTVQHSTV